MLILVNGCSGHASRGKLFSCCPEAASVLAWHLFFEQIETVVVVEQLDRVLNGRWLFEQPEIVVADRQRDTGSLAPAPHTLRASCPHWQPGAEALDQPFALRLRSFPRF